MSRKLQRSELLFKMTMHQPVTELWFFKHGYVKTNTLVWVVSSTWLCSKITRVWMFITWLCKKGLNMFNMNMLSSLQRSESLHMRIHVYILIGKTDCRESSTPLSSTSIQPLGRGRPTSAAAAPGPSGGVDPPQASQQQQVFLPKGGSTIASSQ